MEKDMHDLLWTPSEERIKKTEMYAFMQYVNEKKGLELKNYRELYDFSIERGEEFWDLLWKFLGIISTPYEKVVDDIKKCPERIGLSELNSIMRKICSDSQAIRKLSYSSARIP